MKLCVCAVCIWRVNKWNVALRAQDGCYASGIHYPKCSHKWHSMTLFMNFHWEYAFVYIPTTWFSDYVSSMCFVLCVVFRVPLWWNSLEMNVIWCNNFVDWLKLHVRPQAKSDFNEHIIRITTLSIICVASKSSVCKVFVRYILHID